MNRFGHNQVVGPQFLESFFRRPEFIDKSATNKQKDGPGDDSPFPGGQGDPAVAPGNHQFKYFLKKLERLRGKSVPLAR